ncbi:MAG TPA: RelA/SpoT domain-containing protein [Firmicutes bacterium]|nr:RelA/SpoT domain-containing protein [Bacillota bacterium]
MSLINEFIEDYKHQVDRYEKLAQICAYQCERELKQRGIRALVTYRAKRLDSLLSKARSRAKEKSYSTISDVYDDIVDLAGVRIALFFPGDQEEVDSFIHAHFAVEQVKDFPEDSSHRVAYSQRFSGYAARHYRLRLKGDSLENTDDELTERIIELQVGSVLMHAWAEVEHDLVYKSSTSSKLSQDEYAILDELNGLMHAGEIALERLQRAVKRRLNFELKPFANHYELSSFLYDYVRLACPKDHLEQEIGRTDILFQFLRAANLHSVPHLEPILARCDLGPKTRPLTQQITDWILKGNPDFYKLYNEARISVGRIDPLGAPHETRSYFSQKNEIGRFMHRWVAAEKTVGQLLNSVSMNGGQHAGPQFSEIEKLIRVQDLRDQILYGDRWPNTDQLRQAENYLNELLNSQPEVRAALHPNTRPTKDFVSGREA